MNKNIFFIKFLFVNCKEEKKEEDTKNIYTMSCVATYRHTSTLDFFLYFYYIIIIQRVCVCVRIIIVMTSFKVEKKISKKIT